MDVLGFQGKQYRIRLLYQHIIEGSYRDAAEIAIFLSGK